MLEPAAGSGPGACGVGPGGRTGRPIERDVRFVQRNPVARLLAATLLGMPLALLTWLAAPPALAVVLWVVLTVVAFVGLTLAPDAIALQRRHPWRWWWRSSDDQGPFWPGTRVPRGPRRPRG